MNSVLSQDYEKIKIIVSDDCSTDGTVDLIKEYSKKYPKKIIPLFSDRNLGLTQNIDRATKHCEGKYISHLGGDDMMLKDKISSQVEFMERKPWTVLFVIMTYWLLTLIRNRPFIISVKETNLAKEVSRQ